MARTWLLSCGVVVFLGFGGAGQEGPPPKPPLEFKGYLTPARRAPVTGSVAGRVVGVLVREGQEVKAGQLLVQLDATQPGHEVKRAEARLAAAEARLAELKAGPTVEEKAEARAALAEAEAALEAAEPKAARLARARVDRARAAYNRLVAAPPAERVRAAQAEVALARAALAQARSLLDATAVRSPLDGTVLRVNVEAGSFTNPQGFGLAAAASVAEVADTSALEVEVTFHERNLPRFFKGQRCEVRLDAFPDATHRGAVDRFSPTVDRDQNTLTLWVKLEGLKKDHGLPVDASAVVRFLPR